MFLTVVPPLPPGQLSRGVLACAKCISFSAAQARGTPCFTGRHEPSPFTVTDHTASPVSTTAEVIDTACVGRRRTSLEQVGQPGGLPASSSIHVSEVLERMPQTGDLQVDNFMTGIDAVRAPQPRIMGILG